MVSLWAAAIPASVLRVCAQVLLAPFTVPLASLVILLRFRSHTREYPTFAVCFSFLLGALQLLLCSLFCCVRNVACYLPRYRARLLAKLHFLLIQRSTSLCLLRLSLKPVAPCLTHLCPFQLLGCYMKGGHRLLWARRLFFLSSSQEHPYFHVRSSVFAQGLIFPRTPGIFISPAFCYSLLEQLSFLFPYIFS